VRVTLHTANDVWCGTCSATALDVSVVLMAVSFLLVLVDFDGRGGDCFTRNEGAATHDQNP